MRYILAFFITLSINCSYAQLSQLLKADIVTPGVTYERPFFGSYSASASLNYRPDIFFSKSHNHFYLLPSASIMVRRYFYVNKNIEAGRSYRNNSGNYFFLGNELTTSKGMIPIYNSPKSPRMNFNKPIYAIPFGLGLQRDISKSFYVNFQFGLHYFPLRSPSTIYNSFNPIVNIQFGTILYRERMKNDLKINKGEKKGKSKKNNLERFYVSIDVNNTSGFLKNYILDSYFINDVADRSNQLDFSLSLGFSLKNKTYGVLSIGRTSIEHFFEFNPEGPRGNAEINGVHPQAKITLGVEQYLPLKLKNAHMVLSPRVLAVFENYGNHYLIDDNILIYEFKSPNKVMLGVELMSRFEYKVYKRISAYAQLGYSHVLNGNNFYKHSLYYKDILTDSRIDVLIQETKPFYFNYGVGVKVGLEHSSFYK